MALIVEDGTGLSTAESYISEADATTYHAAYGASATWAAATADQREAALRVATRYLDLHYAGRWRGTRTNEDQALAWPRSGVYDDDSIEVDDDVIPANLERACAEVALRVLTGDDLLGVITETGDVTSESVTVGPISESKTYAGTKSHAYQYPMIESMVAGLIGSGISLTRA